jgi:hypothetical protein
MDPAFVEKDYWIMHAVFGLKELAAVTKGSILRYLGNSHLARV